MVALTRMISAVFRRGGDVSFVVEELKAVFDPRGGQWMGGRYVPSLLAAIGEVIEQHMINIGFMAFARRMPTPAAARRWSTSTGAGNPGHAAASASARNAARRSLMRQEGCDSCTNCGYSKCG